MAEISTIEWTDATWNPTTGCDKVSPGCKNCYAERMAARLKAMGQPRYRNGFELTLQDDVVTLPLRWRKPRLIFVNSMSDLFHDSVPTDFIRRCFDVMNEARHHIYQILTKRPERALEIAGVLPWAENIWLGTSVESSRYICRVSTLQQVPALVRFLSVEPLLSRISELPLESIDWVIVGGESGPNARPMNPEWVRILRDQCVAGGVPFFFKQWGAFGPDGMHRSKKANGREIDGRSWNQLPEAATVGREQLAAQLATIET